MRRAAPLIALLCSPVALAAGEFSLDWPVQCTPGVECHVQNYTDRDPGPGARDVACGALTYDGHKGTDIALPSVEAMARGVPVLAAAPGRVRGVRDGMRDVSMRDLPAEEIAGRDCGNGVVIDHGDGWETQYCHMRQGSLAVAQGDVVAAGQVLGLVGLSGRTEFPHLHLSVRRDGAVVDPFEPGGDPACGATGADLWADDIAYVAGGGLRAGFSDAVPEWETLKLRDLHAATLAGDAPALVFWAVFWGGRAGDVVRIVIDGPEGRFHDTEVTLDRAQAQFFRAGGRKGPARGLPRGSYRGTAELVRAGETLATLTRETRVD